MERRNFCLSCRCEFKVVDSYICNDCKKKNNPNSKYAILQVIQYWDGGALEGSSAEVLAITDTINSAANWLANYVMNGILGKMLDMQQRLDGRFEQMENMTKQEWVDSIGSGYYADEKEAWASAWGKSQKQLIDEATYSNEKDFDYVAIDDDLVEKYYKMISIVYRLKTGYVSDWFKLPDRLTIVEANYVEG